MILAYILGLDLEFYDITGRAHLILCFKIRHYQRTCHLLLAGALYIWVVLIEILEVNILTHHHPFTQPVEKTTPRLALLTNPLQPQLITADPTLLTPMVTMTMLVTTIFTAQCDSQRVSCIDWRTGKGFLHVLLHLASFSVIF